jgi:hypothetical protein
MRRALQIVSLLTLATLAYTLAPIPRRTLASPAV